MKKQAVLFLCALLLGSAAGQSAEESEAPPTVAAQKVVLYQAGLAALQQGETAKALVISNHFRNLDPQDEGGYRLACMAYWLEKDFYSVIATVQIARERGIESVFLYKYMTQALFFVGDFGTSMQGFKKMETLMNRSREKS